MTCIRTPYFRSALMLCSILAGGWPSAQVHASEPRVDVSLLANASAVAPGETFRAAIRFRIPDEYHIYWHNPGQAGAPPSITWSLPDGVTASPLEFPVPTRHVQTHGDFSIVTFIHEGEPLLLTNITVPPAAKVGDEFRISGKVDYPVCKESCFFQKRTVRLALPIAAKSRPADEDTTLLFTFAERALPAAGGKGKFVSLSPAVDKKTIKEGDSFELKLSVDVKKGHHTQSNQPLSEFFIPTSIFPNLIEGIEFGEPVWPKPHVRKDKFLGDISEFEGDFTVTIPAKVVAPTTAGKLKIGGLFKYQACNDKGQCHPPEAVEWSVDLVSTSVRAMATTQPTATPVTATPVTATPAAAPLPGTAVAQTAGGFGAWLNSLGLFGALIGGFIGGLILNIMPCVLPVISIKILSFVQQAGEDPRRVFRLGLTFAAGIIVSFWVILAAILVLQNTTGSGQSWGTLFQQPSFVIGMIVVMFVFALNLFGVFEINLPGTATGKLAAATDREGYTGAFMKGVLATLLATPCTAPFLAPAISFALRSPMYISTAVFTAAGVGMAFPYILLTARPSWMRYLPKPGTWMITFKQLMGFTLIGTAVWLLWILGALLGESGLICTIAFLACCALGCWIYGKVEFQWSIGRKFAMYAMAVIVVVAGGYQIRSQYTPPDDAMNTSINTVEQAVARADWSGSKIPWVPYRPGLAEELAAAGYTVYVDYTATWCVTCQANKSVVLNSDKVKRKMRANNVIPIKADYTRRDARIAKDLKQFQRDAVPLNIVYPAGQPAEVKILPVLLTPGIVLAALDDAGPSTVSMVNAN